MRQLKEGGKIAIVSPSGTIDESLLEEGVEKIRERGYEVEIMPHVVGCKRGVFSAEDSERSADLVEAMRRDDIDAIICARGGYGAVRTLQGIDEREWDRCDKWIVGFSDITAIHSMMVKHGKKSLHGPMIKHVAHHGMDSEDVKQMMEIMSGEKYVTKGRAGEGSVEGESEGVLVGGNLSLVYSLRATPADIDPKGKILFIEDLSEYNYHIDRMVQNLKYSGFLKELKGVVVGQYTGMKDGATAFGKTATEIIVDAVKEYGYPVWTDFEAGHGQEVNKPLVMGARVKMRVSGGQGEIEEAE